MSRVISGMIVLLFSLGLVVPIAMAQVGMFSQTIRGDPLSIKGDMYVIKDIFGRLVYLHVDNKTKRERMFGSGGENQGRCDYSRESRPTSTGEVSP